MLFGTGTLVSLLSLTVHTRMEAQGSPTQIVESAFVAVAHRDWPVLAALIDPTALDSLRQESLGLMILGTEERKAGKEGGGYNPQDVVIPDHLPRVGSERVSQFPDNPTIAQLASLAANDFFQRWCAAVYRPDSEEDPVREVVGLQRRMIGEAQETDSLAHVLYRRESRHVEMNELFIDVPGRVMVMPLRKVQNRWRLLLNDDLGWQVSFMEILHARPPFAAHELKRTTRVAPEPALPPHVPRAIAQPGPAETARTAFVAFERRDWQGLTALVDSERLAAFQREELAYLVPWFNSKEARARAARKGASVFMLSYEDSLPPEAMVAEVPDMKVQVFPNAPTLRELAQLSPAGFFARWCEAVYDVDPDKGPGGGRPSWGRHVVGEVLEGETLAHVLYRSDLKSRQPWSVERMPLKQSASGWRLLLNDDIGWTIDLSMLLNRP
jgi:hypothetical protein